MGYDNLGRLLAEYTYSGSPGLDGIWHTGDEPSTTKVFEYDTAGSVIYEATLLGPGADGIWGNRDDNGYLMSNSIYDLSGLLIRREGLNANRVMANYTTYDYNAYRQLVKEILCLDAGPDAVFFLRMMT